MIYSVKIFQMLYKLQKLDSKYLPPALLSILFSIIFSYYSLYRHLNFNSHAFDLGIYTQITYLYSQGIPSLSSLKHMPLLADHFEPILLILSLIYKLLPKAETLLVLQSCFVSLSSIPIYLISVHKTKSTLIGLLISLAYLTSMGILSAISFDFHSATISVLPLSLIIYFWYFQKNFLYWLTLFISLLFKEDIPIFILGLGFYQIINNQKLLGLKSILFASVSFFVITKIMNFFGSNGGYSYMNTSILPLSDPLSILLLLFIRPTIFLDQVFNSPLKIASIYSLHQPFAFLAILSPLSWLTTFPYLFLRFTSSYQQMWTMNFHHNANLMPFLAVSSAFAIGNFNLPKKPIVILLIFFLLTGGLSPYNLIWTAPRLNIKDAQKFSYINDALKKSVPPFAAVSAQSPIVPHIANREKIYLFPEIYDAEYIVLDSSLGTYPMSRPELQEKINYFKKSKNWRIKQETNNLIIFKKEEFNNTNIDKEKLRI